jgi:hypothetical protein
MIMTDPEVRRYTVHPDEHPDVTAMRVRYAAEERALMRRLVDDPDISDLDLACTMTQVTYGHVRDMARVAMERGIHMGWGQTK